MPDSISAQSYSAFENYKLVAHGSLNEVVLKTKKRLKTNPAASILVFSDLTGKQMDFDLRGTEKELLQRLQVFVEQPESQRESTGPGRPRLGVVAREVSLLPRHWEWLSTQSGGASAILRRLVEAEMKGSAGKETVKQAQERTYKFLSALAGNLPMYEEALRALFAKDKKRFKEHMEGWPADVQSHALSLAMSAFSQ